MLAPMLAKEAKVSTLDHFFDDDTWVLEQKLDGHRVLLCSPGGNFPATALTRGGAPYTRGLPETLRDFRFPEGLAAGEFVIDGELVGGTFYVFDLPVSPATDPATTLNVRRFALEQTFEFWSQGHPHIKLVPQAKTREQKIALADKALKSNFEGLVAKRTESTYISGGRTESWLKVKFVTTADCIVLDVRDDGKESVRLGMVHWKGEGILSDSYDLVDVGRASLIGKEKNGVINKGDVIEVRYLYAGAGGRLYQPTIVRKRTDKEMFECSTDQLKHVNKAVLEAL